jgi:hypothetical protein
MKFLSSCTTGGFSRRAQLHGVNYLQVGLEVPSGVTMMGTISWDVTRCNPEVHRRSGGAYYIHLQGQFMGNARKK